MKASETTLQPVFEGVKQYVIPLFQRTYSWKSKDWETLWDDLMDLYEANDDREHFMGAVVTMPVDMSPHGINKYLLIDGQQRLTTLFILLALIRDLDTTLAEQTNELYLVNKWETGTNRLKLLPTQTDQQAFAQIIDQKELQESSEIAKAHSFFRKRMQRPRDDGQPLDLKRLRSVILQNLMVVSIVLSKDENPYLIFESLNGKGQPLTQADLVRNYIFMRIPDSDQQEAYREIWRPMETQLGNYLSDFFWRYLTKDGGYFRQNTIYEAVKNRLASMSAHGVVDELLDMHTFGGYYRRLVAPSHEPNQSIQRRLLRLNRWEVNTSYPFLLKIYDDYLHQRLTVGEMCQILDAIESYVIRRFFCRVPTNALNRNFISLYGKLDKNDIVQSVVGTLAGQGWPTDEEFLNAWEKFPIYSSGTEKCRHILESIEDALGNNHEPVDITHSRITIEHVMPQRLNETWEAELGPTAVSIHEQYLHTIGNLTLTGMNESMGNSVFGDKKKVFAGSNFALNKYFSQQTKWEQSTILERSKTLGKLALTIWKRPNIIAVSDKSDDPTGYKPTRFVLFGVTYYPTTWRDVLLTTCSVLVQRHGREKFFSLTTQVKGASRQYISQRQEELFVAAPITGTDLWVEVNLAAKDILKITNQILDACGHSSNDFRAYW